MKTRKVVEVTIDGMKKKYRLELYHRSGESKHGHSDELVKSVKAFPYEMLNKLEELFDIKS